ncbi:MAG TPA: 3-phosphoshikimate 1-carboxyvinyltransferase [Polyangiaceae bacterium]|nr:3-phosphoshikimate 1-carboxyvinyltransferase [Polyangiaceae bacterium]
MQRLRVKPATRPLVGEVAVPSDKSISHRALILAALAAGRSELVGFSYGEDNVATLRAFRALGVGITDDGAGVVRVDGVGLDGLRAPAGDLDCGNSGTTMRLLCGVLGAQPFRSRLVGDASLTRRPMGRVVHPLRARGAVITGEPHATKAGDLTAPLLVGPLPPGVRLGALEYAAPIASAQVKSALLLSGLFATGPTVVREPLTSRDHTERMLRALGVSLVTSGNTTTLTPPADPRALAGFTVDLPGDLSAAAFPLVAAALVPGSAVTVRATGLNPTRAGILEALRAFGAVPTEVPRGESLGEPRGDVTVRAAPLTATVVGGEVALRAIDEIPILVVLAARARGRSEFFGVEELRVKESDRIALMVGLLRAFGVEAEERPDGLVVQGRPEGALRAARVTSGGDHRIAMCAAILGLVADGETVIDDAGCIATSFPRFAETLRALGVSVEVE